MTDVEKVRSAEKEADLDRKIEQIRRRNEEIEERHKLVTEEAIQNGIPKSFQKATVNGGHQKMSGSNHTNLKTSETISSTKKGNGIAETKGNQWGREWDRGKTSAEDWKMNVPEFGDHGNSYFKTDGGANGSNNTTTSSRGRGGAGGRGGGHHFQQHQQQRGGGGAGAGRRPGQQGTNKSAPHNPGFFHDDRFDKAKTDENDGIDSAAAPPSADGKQLETNKKIPARNNNHPRKPATMHQKSFENDKNQNDSSKPNMNVSNGYGTRQDYRGGRGGAGAGATPPHRNIFNPSRRGGAPPSSGGSGGPIRQSSNHNTINGINGNQNTSNKFDHQRKTMPKNDGTKPQNFKDSNAATADKHLPSNRGRNFKPFNKPPHYSNQRQNKAPQKFNGTSSKPSSPKLDKDGQAVKRLIDNIIDQVVRQERKEQKKNEGEENRNEDEKQNIEEKNNNGDKKVAKIDDPQIINEEKNQEDSEEKEEKIKDENIEVEKKKENGESGEAKNPETENESKIGLNDEKQIEESNETKPAEAPATESKPSEIEIENVQKLEQKTENEASENHSENQP